MPSHNRQVKRIWFCQVFFTKPCCRSMAKDERSGKCSSLSSFIYHIVQAASVSISNTNFHTTIFSGAWWKEHSGALRNRYWGICCHWWLMLRILLSVLGSSEHHSIQFVLFSLTSCSWLLRVGNKIATPDELHIFSFLFFSLAWAYDLQHRRYQPVSTGE